MLTDHIHIPLGRGVRQGDTISPKLFTAVVEDVLKTLEWDRKGININGVFMSHLCFADDLVLFSERIMDLQVIAGRTVRCVSENRSENEYV